MSFYSISGINYVLAQIKITKRPSVVSMSLGGSPNTALDTAAKAVSDGHVSGF